MPITIKSPALRMSAESPVTPRESRQPQEASSGRGMSMVVIGLAVAARIMRDPRTYETAIVIVIAVAAVTGLGKAGKSSSFARLAAWDERRHEMEQRRRQRRKRTG
jgi:hypothetical protein